MTFPPHHLGSARVCSAVQPQASRQATGQPPPFPAPTPLCTTTSVASGLSSRKAGGASRAVPLAVLPSLTRTPAAFHSPWPPRPSQPPAGQDERGGAHGGAANSRVVRQAKASREAERPRGTHTHTVTSEGESTVRTPGGVVAARARQQAGEVRRWRTSASALAKTGKRPMDHPSFCLVGGGGRGQDPDRPSCSTRHSAVGTGYRRCDVSFPSPRIASLGTDEWEREASRVKTSPFPLICPPMPKERK